jgi:fibrillarin-like rRNA methylase
VPDGSKNAAVTHIDLKQAAAILLLGIAIGCAVSHFYFAAFKPLYHLSTIEVLARCIVSRLTS